ncbi:hypothetical protein BX600DRAFT_320746 [Xylariales sp. PMI_506]|nr:hypothetical protein BX600DRAFT_320746 [Xylariales sp. PMI_506]
MRREVATGPAKLSSSSKGSEMQQQTVPHRSDAQGAVLAKPELLEAILMHMAMRELLVSCQRVCTLWRDAIATSHRLRRRLFFADDPPHVRTVMESRGSGHDDGAAGADTAQREMNPLLQEYFGPIAFAGIPVPAPTAGLQRGNTSRGHRADGVLGTREWMEVREEKGWGLQLPIGDMRDGRRRHLAFTRQGASWRRMLLAKPAPRRIDIMRPKPWVDGSRSRVVAAPEGGLRMGQLYDIVFDMVWGTDMEDGEGRTAAVRWLPPPPPSPLLIRQETGGERGAITEECSRGSVDMVIWSQQKDDHRAVRQMQAWRDNAAAYDLFRKRPVEYPERFQDRTQYIRTRSRQSSAWMFKCDEYDAVSLEAALEKKDLSEYS